MNSTDTDLLRRYVTERSEVAFAELVRRHIDLVYSAALRQLGGNQQQAEDVTQAVFSDLARKSHRLTRHTSLTGWLYTSTRYAATSLWRAEHRRSIREHEAHLMSQLAQQTGTDVDWEQVRPILDEVMHELKQEDREAILLRFFDRLPLVEVGSRLGVVENTARMRVERAMGKLRARLALRGIGSTAAVLGTALAQQAVRNAPTGLAANVTLHSASLAAGPGVFGTLAGKAALVAVAVIVAGVFGLSWKLRHTRSAIAPNSFGIGVTEAIPTAEPNANGGELVAAAGSAKSSGAVSGTELFFVDDQTGAPITNRVAWLKGWERGSQLLVEKTVELEQGRCVAPFDPKFGGSYWILSHIESYADVSLKWNPERGERIPESYLVRLVRPVLIHGRVVDPAGEPVAGAEVAFGNDNIPGSDLKPESHAIEHLTVRTDAQGHWQINRIAPDCVRYLDGSASHTNFSQSEYVSVGRNPERAQQLIDGTFTFQLGPGIVVQGTVVDPAGQPVARAQVHVGGVSETGSRDAQTASDGSFRILGCRPGKQCVTAESPGYAPAVLSLNLQPNLAPVKLTLTSGRTLRVRVIDAAGQPIDDAVLWYSAFGRQLQEPFPQVDYTGKSDSAGSIVWEHAPDQDLEFDCHASGHMRVSDIVLHPDDQEHVITLPAALVITGRVSDADTGELVPRFKLGIGWPDANDGSQPPRWSTIDRFWPTFTGGEFRHSLEEAVVGGTDNRGYIFRFEAVGYAPFVTRVYRADEGEVALDIQLKKAEETLVTVYTPAGRAASDAQVGLLAPGSELKLVPGGFSTMASMSSTWLRKADAQGQFVFPTDDAVQRIAIAHPEGYLECSRVELKKSPTVRLQPWGQIDGTWLEAGQAAADREVSLSTGSKAARSPLQLEYSAYRTTTDAQGHFVFRHVPPIPLDIVTWRKSSSRGSSYGEHSLAVQARAGETVHVTVGNTNRVNAGF